MYYATLDDARAYLTLQPTETLNDSAVDAFCRRATSLIEKQQGRRYDVRLETQLYDLPTSSDLLRLRDYLASLSSVTNGDGTAIATSDIWTRPSGSTIITDLVLKPSAGVTWEPAASDDEFECISVAGLWGYHPKYSKAWVNSQDALLDDVLAIDTTLPVTSIEGSAADLQSPRFQVGQLLSMQSGNNREFLTVLAVNVSENSITVERGANGTTALPWVEGQSILVYRPFESVVHAALELVKTLYNVSIMQQQGVQEIAGTGIRITPQTFPKHIVQLLPTPKVGLR